MTVTVNGQTETEAKCFQELNSELHSLVEGVEYLRLLFDQLLFQKNYRNNG